MWASAVTRSTGERVALPREEQAPRMHWIAERRRANDILHLNQFMVWL